MIQKIFFNEDSYIINESGINYGADELLRLKSQSELSADYSRLIVNVPFHSIASFIGQESFKAVLSFKVSEQHNIPLHGNICIANVPKEWEEGFGKSYDEPVSHEGVTWYYSDSETEWGVPGIVSEQTPHLVREFVLNAEGELRLDVTQLVSSWTQENSHGLILWLEYENSTVGTDVTFYSSQTHTVYRPFLEVGYLDQVYEPDREVQAPFTINAISFKESFSVLEKPTIRLSAKPIFPERIYTTSSLYREEYHLPEDSQWSIRDEYTGQTIIPFSPYTGISSDLSGSYFSLDIGMLDIERFYRFYYKIVSTNGTNIIPGNVFKVTK